MRKIADRVIMLLFSVPLIYISAREEKLLVVIYLSLALSAFFVWFTDEENAGSEQEGADEKRKENGGYSGKKIITILIHLLSLILVFMFPGFTGIIPIVIYDIIVSRDIRAGIMCLILQIYLYSNFRPVEAVYGIFNNSGNSLGIKTDAGLNGALNRLNLIVIIYIFIVAFIAWVLQDRRKKIEELDKGIKRLRDDAKEKQMKLNDRNQEIIKAKDSEVVMAQLSERNRIAREIHDNVGHSLSRAILQIGALLYVHKDEKVKEDLENLRETLDDAMNKVRESVHDLHDESVKLSYSLNKIVEPLYDNFDVDYVLDTDEEVPADIKYAIIGIVKEGVSNIIKHSENNHVNIRVEEHPAMYQIEIHDYNSTKVELSGIRDRDIGDLKIKRQNIIVGKSGKGIGLENIYSRVEGVKGNVSITDEDGFRIFVTIPKEK
ncbi:MAG: hypothetical protein K6D02_00155 [Lachnospiraceae bacterium]|nr:hypothetical protein [Lachnospiraceae bacterium]